MRVTSAIAPKGDDGKSAYQLWLEGGGVGSLAVYQASLKGDKGDAATIAPGMVTMLTNGATPTVANSGTTSAAVFNFGIPAPLNGTNAANPSFTGAASGLSAGASPTAVVTGSYPNLTLTIGVPVGAAGSSAAATPLSSTLPVALGTAAIGVSTTAARADHVHTLPAIPVAASTTPLVASSVGTIGVGTTFARNDHVHPVQAGTLALVGNIVVTETLLISLSLGVKRMTLPLATITTADKLVAIPNGTPTAGCEMINVYPISAGNVSVGYFLPALGIGATYSIPVSVYRIS